MEAELLRPWLQPGARVVVVAPSSPFDADAFRRGVARLRQRYDVRHDPQILDRTGFLAGADARRLRELQSALDDDSVAAIIAARGGHGATRLLPGLDAARLRAHPKLLVGFSDITALHALWAQARVSSVHGAMVATLGNTSDSLYQRWVDAVEGRGCARVAGLQTIVAGRAEGRLLGGNLTVLTALLGTPHFPDLRGGVLFFEDVGERPYRIDRMLTSWRNADAFHGVRGVVLGAFEQAQAGEDGTSAQDVLSERLSDLGIPVASGLPAGHVDDNLELPLGTLVTLDANRGELNFNDRSQA
jgi:muramoyltetrapeptide carboxypeptidase